MKKRILLLVISFGLIVFITLYGAKDVKFVQTMAFPVTNKVIVIDAGHGKPDSGAENENGVSEEAINLKIALKLQQYLESSGATVLLTRSDENGIYELDSKTIAQKKVSDIKNRVKIANESSADIYVSIHLNKIPQGQYWGWQTFYNGQNKKSKELADYIQKNLNATISNDNKRETKKLDTIYIMKNVEIPIALVECGFLSNEQEAQKLEQDEYQSKLAWGIYDGIMDYFNAQ